MTTLQVRGVNQPRLDVPANFRLIVTERHHRNGELVTVQRYQPTAPAIPYCEHVSLVWGSDGRLLSFNRFVRPTGIGLPSPSEAQVIAEATMLGLDALYAHGLHFMRVLPQARGVIIDGHQIEIPMRWVKFGHDNGSYNLVGVGAGGRVVECEREAFWDYARGRRATEEWNFDQWVLAREGRGIQPPAPESLA